MIEHISVTLLIVLFGLVLFGLAGISGILYKFYLFFRSYIPLIAQNTHFIRVKLYDICEELDLSSNIIAVPSKECSVDPHFDTGDTDTPTFFNGDTVIDRSFENKSPTLKREFKDIDIKPSDQVFDEFLDWLKEQDLIRISNIMSAFYVYKGLMPSLSMKNNEEVEVGQGFKDRENDIVSMVENYNNMVRGKYPFKDRDNDG
jgi:hypothetical protein